MSENEATGTSQQFAEGLFVESLRRELEGTIGRPAKITQNGLATAMRERGHKFHQATVFKILKGERKITLGEALDIAAILDVPLERMLRPGDRRVQMVLFELNALEARKKSLANGVAMARYNMTSLRKALADLPSELRKITPKEVLERAEHHLGTVPLMLWMRTDLGPVEQKQLAAAIAPWAVFDAGDEGDDDANARDVR